MKDTGERMIPEHHKGLLIYDEHVTRYEAVLKLVEGKTVLDIACGSGYGSRLIGDKAKKVYGVDISPESIAYANQHYNLPNIEFLVGEATSIPLKDASVDVVISFETIEHVADYEQFLNEIKRVLKPGGELVISTPNEEEFPEGNEFHVHEFIQREFEKVLNRHFKHVVEYYQGDWLYSAVLNTKQFSEEWSEKILTLKTTKRSLTKAVYILAVCSDSKPSQLLAVGSLSRPWSDKDQIAHDTGQKHQIDNAKAELSVARKEIDELREITKKVTGSKSWKITTPLRKASKIIKKLRGRDGE